MIRSFKGVLEFFFHLSTNPRNGQKHFDCPAAGRGFTARPVQNGVPGFIWLPFRQWLEWCAPRNSMETTTALEGNVDRCLKQLRITSLCGAKAMCKSNNNCTFFEYGSEWRPNSKSQQTLSAGNDEAEDPFLSWNRSYGYPYSLKWAAEGLLRVS